MLQHLTHIRNCAMMKVYIKKRIENNRILTFSYYMLFMQSFVKNNNRIQIDYLMTQNLQREAL